MCIRDSLFILYSVSLDLGTVCFLCAYFYYLAFSFGNNIFVNNFLSLFLTIYIFYLISYIGFAFFTFFYYGFNAFVNIIIFFFNGTVFNAFFFGNFLVCYTVNSYLGFFCNLLIYRWGSVIITVKCNICYIKKC